MSRLLFGTAGVPLSARARTTQAGIERIAELGLECLEVQFVQGVKMTKEAALPVGKLAAQKKVALTAHAPYAINLNAREPEKVKASQERLLQSARVAAVLGAKGVVFHAAFYLADSTTAVYANVKKHLEEVRTMLKREGNQVLLRPEVTGKASQFGSIEELLRLSAEMEGVAPCLDFSHWHARTGKLTPIPNLSAFWTRWRRSWVSRLWAMCIFIFPGFTTAKRGKSSTWNCVSPISGTKSF